MLFHNLGLWGGKFADSHIVIDFVECSKIIVIAKVHKKDGICKDLGDKFENKMKQARERGECAHFLLLVFLCLV